jgi:DNA-binding transcriptional regulator YiaG
MVSSHKIRLDADKCIEFDCTDIFDHLRSFHHPLEIHSVRKKLHVSRLVYAQVYH